MAVMIKRKEVYLMRPLPTITTFLVILASVNFAACADNADFSSDAAKVTDHLANGEVHDSSILADSLMKDSDGSSGLRSKSTSNNNSWLDGLSQETFDKLSSIADAQKFHTDHDRIMKLIINSIYRNKEIFMRELISNSADALDKIRYLSLKNPEVLETNPQLFIRIKVDEDNNMIHISDSGIGMTASHLREYLGTIARSQTNEFIKSVEKAEMAQDQSAFNDLIGQFGVGFYSAFLVADKVIVTSKHNDDDQYIWESNSNEFRVMKDPRGNTLQRGTTVSLQLKKEAFEYLNEAKIRSIVLKHSQYLNYPIYLWTMKEIEEEVSTDQETSEEDQKVVDEDESKKPETEKVKSVQWLWEHVNDVKPIWMRDPNEVTHEEYVNFYKSLAKRDEEPLLYVHFAAEGEVNFRSIVYVPLKAPPIYSTQLNTNKFGNMKLYVRRVFITDEAELLPSYLNFAVGTTDSDDLSLNLSREELQQSKFVKTIKKKLTRKILDKLKMLNQTQYDKFWKEFGTNIKFGVMEDSLNRLRLSKLLRFYSSHSTLKGKQRNFTSLEEYVQRAKPDQKSIYFISGRSVADANDSPFLEKAFDLGHEVLYFVDPADQICVQNLPKFGELSLQNVAKEGLDFGETDAKRENQEKQFEPLSRWLEESFSDKVIKVLLSDRLVKTPMIFVTAPWGQDAQMEKLSRAQAYQKVGGDSATVHFADIKRKMEINPRHPLIREMLRLVQQSRSDPNLRELAEVCVDMAWMRSGFEIKDPAMFARRVETFLKQAMHLDSQQYDDEVDTMTTDRDEDASTDHKNYEHEEL